jgi:hypothetical protein
MTKFISTTETAKIIRKELKANFPGIKFSVRSKTYAGGSSIHIEWIDGPITAAVESVMKRFQGASFDSMYDIKNYHDSEWEGEKVHFCADYVFSQRNLSRTFVETVVAQFCKRWGLAPSEINIYGDEKSAGATFKRYDYSKEHWLSDLLRNTDGKDVHDAYAAEERERAAWEKAYAEQQAREARERAEAEAKAEQERKAKEQAEFEQFKQEKLNNEQWMREQFKLWQEEKARQEAERKAKEQAERERQEAERRAQEKAERERQQRERQERIKREQEERERRQREQKAREQFRVTKQTILASRERCLNYLGLSARAGQSEIKQAFRQKVKAAADGKGGYTIDMDFLVKVKEKALG